GRDPGAVAAVRPWSVALPRLLKDGVDEVTLSQALVAGDPQPLGDGLKLGQNLALERGPVERSELHSHAPSVVPGGVPLSSFWSTSQSLLHCSSPLSVSGCFTSF